MSPSETLSHIATRLADTSPFDLIADLLPRVRSDAITWARRLAHWEEFRGRQPDQAIGLARVVSRRAMREFGLEITNDGRVVDCHRSSVPNARPTAVFRLVLVNQPVEVRYTRDYFPYTGIDDIAFAAACNPLSDSGHWHTFVPHDAVEACGGPKLFAAAYAEAKLTEREKEFMEQFEGRFREPNAPRRHRPARQRTESPPVVGKHSGDVVERPAPVERQETPGPFEQKGLF